MSTLTLAQQTRIAIQIIVTDDTGDLLYLLAFATHLVVFLAAAVRGISACGAYLAGWLVDLTEALVFTAKVAGIAFNSLAFGLGVSL